MRRQPIYAPAGTRVRVPPALQASGSAPDCDENWTDRACAGLPLQSSAGRLAMKTTGIVLFAVCAVVIGCGGGAEVQTLVSGNVQGREMTLTEAALTRQECHEFCFDEPWQLNLSTRLNGCGFSSRWWRSPP